MSPSTGKNSNYTIVARLIKPATESIYECFCKLLTTKFSPETHDMVFRKSLARVRSLHPADREAQALQQQSGRLLNFLNNTKKSLSSIKKFFSTSA